MRKFKLIKEFPLSPAKGTIATFKTMQEEIEGIYDMGAIPNLILTDCTYYPEFWEEIKEEPLFITEDGIPIYSASTSVWSVTEYFRIFECFTKKSYSNCKMFSTKEAAEKYIEENKPLYSKKQIKEALSKTYLSTTNGTFINESLFKQQLRI